MVWGCIAHGRCGLLFRVPKEERKGPDYIRNILAGVLWGFYKKLYRERGMVAIMEDGAPVHRSKVAKNFCVEHKIEVLPHPAQSPDLNPIEHVWTRLKTGINKQPVMPQNVDELWTALQEE